MSFAPSKQFYSPCRTSSGIEYFLRVDPGTYGEKFLTEGSQVTTEMIVRWSYLDRFIREILGYSYYDPAAPDRFRRVLPMAVPYRRDLYAAFVDTIAVGTYDDENSFSALVYPDGHPLAGQSPVGKPTFYIDPSGAAPEGDWPKWGHAVLRVTFTHRPYRNLKTDAQLAAGTPTVSGAVEFDRFVVKDDPMQLRELRAPDEGLETDEPDPKRLSIVGFVANVEKEVFYTWHEVPYARFPRTAAQSRDLLTAVNSVPFDGYEAGTLLYCGCERYERPFRSAAGDLYVSPRYHFRWHPIGWNRVLLPSRPVGDQIVGIRRPSSKLPPYRTTDQFFTLFRPEP